MIKYLLRIMVYVVIGAVLLSVAYEIGLNIKGTEVSVDPMGIIFFVSTRICSGYLRVF